MPCTFAFGVCFRGVSNLRMISFGLSVGKEKCWGSVAQISRNGNRPETRVLQVGSPDPLGEPRKYSEGHSHHHFLTKSTLDITGKL